MAITVYNTARLSTPAYTGTLVGAKVSFSAVFRINSLKATGAQTLYARLFNIFATTNPNNDPALVQMEGIVQQSSTSNTGAALKPRLELGSVHHFAFVYDKDDPTRQRMIVNGVPVPTPRTSALPMYLPNSASSIGGGASRPGDFTIQDVLFLDGYALSDADVAAIMADPTASATIGADVVGVTRAYYSCDGTEGSAVHVGDAGVTVAGKPQLSFNEPILSVGDSVTYAPRMAYASEAVVDFGYTRSSGTSLTLVLKNSRTGRRISPAANALVTPPTITVDDGPPIALPNRAGGGYASSECQAPFLPFPAGVKVVPGEAVKLSAPANWLLTEIGPCPAIANLAIANRSGRPCSMETWPEPDRMRVGVNQGAPISTYWSPIVANKNRALDYPIINLSNWPDGTLAENHGGILAAHAGANGVDKVGWLYKTGLWVVGWGDVDRSDPVTFAMTPPGEDMLTFVERTEYRNLGDAQGKGKVRVYDVQFTVRTPTLKASINATQTAIDVNETYPYIRTDATRYTYLTIGAEKVLVGSFDTAARRFNGCTRGWLGTTAASHAAGSVARQEYSIRYGYVWLTISSPSKKPHYEDFRMYSPGEWTVPSPPAPVVLPDEPWDALDSGYESYFEEGCGVLRCMDSTPVFTQTSEPEHVALSTDPHWNGNKLAEQWFFKSARPFDPAVSRYVYVHIGGFNSEKYAATLGAATDATQATITIGDGRTAPILMGQYLYVGDETMKVLEIPKLSGTQYKVERGCMGTTPSAHAAGPIQVGYRIPITNASQYDVANTNHFCEIVLDEAPSTSLRYGVLLSNVGGIVADDANLTSRMSLTLPDGLPATSTALTFKVVPAFTSDWDRLGANLTLTVDSEKMTIFSADRTAGTVTVTARSSPVAHAAGAVGATKSGNVLYQKPDGSGKVWKEYFTAKCVCMPTGIDTFLVQPAKDTKWGTYASQGSQAAGVQAFEAGKSKTEILNLPKTGFPYAFGPSIASKAKGCDFWLNIPYLASDALVHHIAVETRDHMIAGRKVIVEFSNETWNTGFAQYNHQFRMGPISGCELENDYSIVRGRDCVEIFKRVFAEHGREDEIFFLVAWQSLPGPLSWCRRLGIDPDGVSVAPYLNLPPSADMATCVNAITNAQVCDLYSHYQEFGQDGNSYKVANDSAQAALALHEQLTGKRPELHYYEGGDGTIVPYTSSSAAVKTIDAGLRARDVHNDPEWWNVQQDQYSIYKRMGNPASFAVYMLGFAYTGAVPFMWSLTPNGWMKAGYGDGRDGGHDNRTLLFQQGQANSANALQSPDTVSEQVRLQAWKDHQTAYFAEETPPDPDPDPTDVVKIQRPLRLVFRRLR